MRLFFRFALPALLLCLVCVIRAQSAADQATLEDLKTASKQMRLEAGGVTPFRLEATVETTNVAGETAGTAHLIEEFASLEALRQKFTDEGASGQLSSPASGNSAQTRVTFMQRYVMDAALRPGPNEDDLASSRISYKQEKVGGITLRCVVLDPKIDATAGVQPLYSRAYCLSAGAPLIRLAQLRYGLVVTYNGFARFSDHLYARDVAISQFGKNRARLHVTNLVAAPGLTQANLPAPALGNGSGTAVHMEPAVVAGQLISKAYPEYPPLSRLRRVTGSVYLQIVIDKEGKVASTEVISAPATDLAESAVETVRKWRYKPYLLNGAPVEVTTTATVNFTMAH